MSRVWCEDKIICPHCHQECDDSDFNSGGNTTQEWDCEHCENQFEVEAEYTPSYTSRLLYRKICLECGTNFKTTTEAFNFCDTCQCTWMFNGGSCFVNKAQEEMLAKHKGDLDA